MKILFTLLVFALSVTTFAQDFSGRVTYQSKMILKDFNEKVAEDPSKISKSFIEAVKRASEKTFILEISGNLNSKHWDALSFSETLHGKNLFIFD